MDSRALIGFVLALAACRGPHPEIQAVATRPAPEPGFQRVIADVHNGGGAGEFELEITLRGSHGEVIHEQRTHKLGSHANGKVVIDVAAPADTYTVHVDADYPE